MLASLSQLDHTLFAYSAYDSSTSPAYDAPNEFTLSYDLTRFRLEHNERVAEVPDVTGTLVPPARTALDKHGPATKPHRTKTGWSLLHLQVPRSS